MSILTFSLLLWLGSLATGLLGALTGLGGGVVLVSLLTLVFGVDMRYAIGASLISLIATASGAATPVARVAFAAFAFARLRDSLYVLVSLAVLGVLLYSLAGS